MKDYYYLQPIANIGPGFDSVGVAIDLSIFKLRSMKNGERLIEHQIGK